MKYFVNKIRTLLYIGRPLLLHELQRTRLNLERFLATLFHPNRRRILATACWNFPIYSQTFVYQELTQLIRSGFSLRFIYSKLDSHRNLPQQFDPVWHARRKLGLHPAVCRRDYIHYKRRMPGKIDELIALLSSVSGLSETDVKKHSHFMQAFAFTRMVEAYRPDYLHSYFFYEGTLFTFIASHLLGIPRGVSCYADHMLNDYPFKMVSVHLKQCSLVVATSNSIRKELLGIAPEIDADRIVVKPNAINCLQFPLRQRSPESAGIFRVVSVSRIEQKKGLIHMAEALARLKERNLDVRWHHIGSTDSTPAAQQYESLLKSKIEELNLSGIAHLEGQKTEEGIKEIFRKSDVFVAPFVQTDAGDKDGIPTSLLEGMASGLAVVATDAGSIQEVVENGRDGLLVPQRDAEALAASIAELLKNSGRREMLGKNAAQKIREKFDVDVCEKAFHDRLSALLQPGDKTSRNVSTGTPLVSVIMIFFNAEKFFQEAIQSVFAQTYNNWELLLIDDGSTDSGTQVAKKYAADFPSKVRYYEHPEHQNRGMSAARNLGIGHANGKYIAFLDADDVYLPQKLEAQVPILESHPDVGMLYGATEYWFGWTGKAEDAQKDNIPSLGVQTETIYNPPSLLTILHPLGQLTAPSLCSLLVRTDAIKTIEGFEEPFTGCYEDQPFLTKIYLNYSVFVSSGCWDRYRMHPDSCSAIVKEKGNYDQFRESFLRWLKSYLETRNVIDARIWLALNDALGPYQYATQGRGDARWLRLLRVSNDNEAHLMFFPDNPDMVRIDITRAGTKTSHDIQLNLPRLKGRFNDHYSLNFLARADAPRSIGFGFARARAPWTNLGLYKQIQLTPEWHSFESDFSMTGDEDNARIHFDLGGDPAAVEVSSLTLRNLNEGKFIKPDLISGQPAPSLQNPHRELPVDLGQVRFGSLRRVTPISPDFGCDRGRPIDRYYIEDFLERHREDVTGRVLEVGDNTYTRRFGGDRVAISDVLHVVEGEPEATIIADLSSADHIPSNSFDCIILTQTLQLIYDVRAAIKTIYRILKPSGVLLTTFPGISQTYDNEWNNSWCWSFTAVSAERLFHEAFPVGNVDIRTYGNVLSAISFLHGLAVEELSPEELNHREPGYDVTIAVRAVKPRPMNTAEQPAPAALRLQKSTNRKALILMYHRVTSDCADPWSLCVTPQHFDEHLKVLKESGTTMPLPAIVSAVREQRLPERAVALTFDDGYADNLEHAEPLLTKHGIPATFFLTAGYLGGREFWWDELYHLLLQPLQLPEVLRLLVQGSTREWNLDGDSSFSEARRQDGWLWKSSQEPPSARHTLYLSLWRILQPLSEEERRQILEELRSWAGMKEEFRASHRTLTLDEVTELAQNKLIELGSHTVTHPLLPHIPWHIQQEEVEQSKRRLQTLLGRPVDSFAYPYGSYTPRTAAIVREAGFQCACSTVPKAVHAGSDPFQLPRVEAGDWNGDEFRRRLHEWLD